MPKSTTVPHAGAQVVVVLGPNLPRPFCDTGTLHVHDARCHDVLRYPRPNVQASWDVEVSDVAEVIEAIYPSQDFCYDPADADEYAGYRGDVHVFPCVVVPEQS